MEKKEEEKKREEEKKIEDAIEVHVESNEFHDENDSQQGPSNLPTGVTHNDEQIFHSPIEPRCIDWDDLSVLLYLL